MGQSTVLDLPYWHRSYAHKEISPNNLAARNIPAGLPAWAQFSRRIFGCKSWTGLQDLAPINQEPEHCSHPLSQTIWCLESQLQQHSRTVKTISHGTVTDNNQRKPKNTSNRCCKQDAHFLPEGSCTVWTRRATAGALSWCSPGKQAWGWVRKLNTWRAESCEPAKEQGRHTLSVTYALTPEHSASLYHLDVLNSQKPNTHSYQKHQKIWNSTFDTNCMACV